VDALQPPQIILVHGEKSEMRKLRDGLAKRMEGKVRWLPCVCLFAHRCAVCLCLL